MNEKPERREGGRVLVGEDLAEVGLDMGGPSERGIVAQQAKMNAVGGKAPERLIMLIQIVLKRKHGGTRPVGREGWAAPFEGL